MKKMITRHCLITTDAEIMSLYKKFIKYIKGINKIKSTSITLSNGLTETGETVKLVGTLTGNKTLFDHSMDAVVYLTSRTKKSSKNNMEGYEKSC